MRRLSRSSPAFLGATCLLAGLVGCSRQSPALITTPTRAAAQEPNRDEGKKPAAPAPEAEQAKAEPPGAGQAAASPFTGDRATKLVADALRPAEKPFADEVRKGQGQRPLSGPAFLEQPALPLPPAAGEVRRLTLKSAGKPFQPGPLPAELPLSRYRDNPSPPRREELPSLGLVHLPSADVNRPVALPTLARPQPDRAPLTDPAADVSVAAVLAAPVPVREAPAPFVRLNLPDPFEHAQAVRLHAPPDEDPAPPLVTIRPPTK